MPCGSSSRSSTSSRPTSHHPRPPVAGTEQHEADEREDPAARDEHADGAERAEERRDLRELHVLHPQRRYVTALVE